MLEVFKRKAPPPAPLLSDAEMKRLNEVIFEAALSIELLFHIYDTSMPNSDASYEWVMDRQMWNRIRRLTQPSTDVFFFDAPRPDLEVQLIGLPIVIEPFAKLAIRERQR